MKLLLQVKQYLKLMRVKQYLKNFLIFLPIVFSGKFMDLHSLIKTGIGFLAFSLSASIVYIINDIKDIESDREHPKKSKRPLASGAIVIKSAKIFLILFGVLAVCLNYIVAKDNLFIWGIIFFYIGSNLAYSMGLKHVPIIDVLILALGYILRVYYGALIINVEVSSWLYLTVISMSFFLGLGKRRNELRNPGEKATRRVLEKYNYKFLDKMMYMFLGLTIIFYSLWCEAMASLKASSLILFTIPIVILICMAYSLAIEGDSTGDPTEVVYDNKILLLLVGVYVIAMAIIFGIGKYY